MIEATLFDPNWRTDDPVSSKEHGAAVDVNARESEVLYALRLLVVASSVADIQAALRPYGLVRERNCLARRLTSLERKSKVRRVGFRKDQGKPSVTLWAIS